jgi:hypothetical protein
MIVVVLGGGGGGGGGDEEPNTKYSPVWLRLMAWYLCSLNNKTVPCLFFFDGLL